MLNIVLMKKKMFKPKAFKFQSKLIDYRIKSFLFVLVFMIGLLANSVWAQKVQAANTITLDQSIIHQTITGWEAVAWIGQDEVIYQNQINAVKGTLFDLAYEVGINRLRLALFGGQENPVDYFTPWITGQQPRFFWTSHRMKPVNDNNDPFSINWSGFQFTHLDNIIDMVVLPFKAILEANGEKLYVNLNYSDFESSTFEHYFDPEEYAEFILATFQHMDSEYGFVPDAVEIILEPDWASAQGQDWNPIRVANCLVATAKRLKAIGYTPDFIAPSNSNMGSAVSYFDQMIANVPEVLNYLTEFSYHRYGGVSISNLQNIADRSKQYGIGAAMLEWWSSGNSYKTLHEDLKIGRNTAWQQGALAGPDNPPNTDLSVLKIDPSNPNNVVVQVLEKTKYFRQYYKFIRAAATRIDATTTNNNFDPLAFINANGKYVVVVKADSGGSFSIQGLQSGIYGIKYTTGDGFSTPTAYDVDLTDQTLSTDQTLTTNIPNEGVITVYQKSVAPTDNSPPTTPKSLTATPKSENQIDLTWQSANDPESSISNYSIYRNDSNIGQSATTSFSDTGLNEGTEYTYEVSAVNGAGLEGTKSAQVSSTTFTDNTPPTITSVSANGDPTKVTVVFSESLEQASATNVSNYQINSGITISGASLGSDSKTVTLNTSPHNDGITYTLTVNNVKDRASNPNAIASNTKATYTFVAQLIISNLTVASGQNYEVVQNGLTNGALVYIDRSFTYTSIPTSMQGSTYIKTANNDKSSSGSSFLTFDVNQDVTVYVAHDNRITSKPTWMATFTDTGDDLVTSDVSLSIFSKDYPAGTITLGGNEGSGNSMYAVVVVGQGNGSITDTTPPLPPTGLTVIAP